MRALGRTQSTSKNLDSSSREPNGASSAPYTAHTMRVSLKKKRYAGVAKGVLQGIRILDLSRLFAGNFLTQL